MYEVRITKKGARFDFRSDFFPRKLHYKKEAKELVEEVESKGGKAEIINLDKKETRVICRSGLTGWQQRLRSVYSNNKANWLAAAETYGLHLKLGYQDAEEAWEENPLVQGSVQPSDYCKIVKGKRQFFNCVSGQLNEE